MGSFCNSKTNHSVFPLSLVKISKLRFFVYYRRSVDTALPRAKAGIATITATLHNTEESAPRRFHCHSASLPQDLHSSHQCCLYDRWEPLVSFTLKINTFNSKEKCCHWEEIRFNWFEELVLKTRPKLSVSNVQTVK